MFAVVIDAFPKSIVFAPATVTPAPIPIWLSAVALPSAASPMKVLFDPVLIESPAFKPTATLLSPVVITVSA